MKLPDRVCTLAERRADGVIHVLGIAFAAIAAPLLIALAAAQADGPATAAAVAVYAVGLAVMFAASAAYNMSNSPVWKGVLRRCDHAAIYIKIAATQTPFAVFVSGADALPTLALIWAAGLAGATAKLAFPESLGRLSAPLYLLMGWGGLLVIWPGADGVALSGPALTLAVLGGVLYSVGVIFYLMERLPFHVAIWHGFVLVATASFYGAVATELGARAPMS